MEPEDSWVDPKLVHLRGQDFPSVKLQWLEEEVSVKPQPALEPSRDGAIQRASVSERHYCNQILETVHHWSSESEAHLRQRAPLLSSPLYKMCVLLAPPR